MATADADEVRAQAQRVSGEDSVPTDVLIPLIADSDAPVDAAPKENVHERTKPREIEIVLAAAERQHRRLLAEASRYEQLGMTATVSEYMREHIMPLRDAMNSVRERCCS
jgi:hypothetical protein